MQTFSLLISRISSGFRELNGFCWAHGGCIYSCFETFCCSANGMSEPQISLTFQSSLIELYSSLISKCNYEANPRLIYLFSFCFVSSYIFGGSMMATFHFTVETSSCRMYRPVIPTFSLANHLFFSIIRTNTKILLCPVLRQQNLDCLVILQAWLWMISKLFRA